MRFPHGVLSSSVSLLVLAAAANAATYNCTTMNVPAIPTGINNAGYIVGTGYIRDPAGNVTPVSYPAGTTGSTRLFTINNNGVSVGFSGNGSAQSVVFTRDLAGNFKTVPVPPEITSFPMSFVFGINDAGDISAFYQSFFILHQDGSTTPVGSANLPGLTAPGAINNASLMLETNPFGGNAALNSPGAMPTVIGANDPSGTGPFAFGLNNAGTVVGFVGHYLKSPPFGPPWTGFTRDASGIYSTLVCTGLDNIQPYAINDNGVVTGAATAAFVPTYFLATPIPGSAQFNASVTSIDFGDVPNLRASDPRTFVVSNSGNARMDIGGVRVKGYLGMVTSPSFSASACMSQNVAVASLDPGASCVVTVRAVPSVPFPPPPGIDLSDIVLIDDSAPGSPQQIPVSAHTVATPPAPPPPSCTVGNFIPGPPRQIDFTIQDQVSGLQSIAVYTSTNANATLPAFAAGATGAVMAAMTEIDPAHPSSLNLLVTNTVGLTSHCSADIAGGANQWTSVDASFTGKVALVIDADALLEAFARAPDGSLLHSAQSLTDGSWSAWENLGGVLTGDPVAVLNPANGVEVFGVGTDGALWHNRQGSPGSMWSGWAPLGGSIQGKPAIARNSDGRLEIFARGGDSTLWQIAEVDLAGDWGPWQSLGGYITGDPVTAPYYADNIIEVFAPGADGALWQIAQTAPGTDSWSSWNALASGPFIGNPVVAPNNQGQLEVFIHCTDDSLWHNVQSAAGDQVWTGWASLGGSFTSDPSVAINADGRLEVFGRGVDNALWHSAQTTPGGSFPGWTTLGGYLGPDVAAILNPNGRMEVYAQAGDGTLWHIAQVYPGFWN